MDIEKFTERSRGFLQAAQTIAIREFHQRIGPEHLLKALLDDEEGAASGLIRAAGGDPQATRNAVEAELARQSKVQGSGASQPQITPDLVRVLDGAQQSAQKAGDGYVAQDRLLLAIANGDGPTARALRDAGALRVRCEGLAALRANLAEAFHGLLTPQDQAGWRPHVTIQNKVDPADARRLHAMLLGDPTIARPLAITGIATHFYRGGPWEPIARYRFG